MDGYPIGDVAALAHVSVRTLHHYDEIGLLSPSARTPAGHRRYDEADLQRLQTILFYRELDFGLAEIAAMLAGPGAGTDTHLRKQHQLLRARRDRDERLLRAIENAMEARKMGMSLTPEEQFEVFGTDKVGGEWADGPRARALAEAHLQFLNRWFYECEHAFHQRLAEMYVADERFSATYEAVAPGLAQYVHDAIVANAAAHST